MSWYGLFIRYKKVVTTTLIRLERDTKVLVEEIGFSILKYEVIINFSEQSDIQIF